MYLKMSVIFIPQKIALENTSISFVLVIKKIYIIFTI
jgi:hypothetical protein